MCSIWGENFRGWPNVKSTLYFSFQTTVVKLKQRLYCISPPLPIIFSFPFCFELFQCNGLKYFDSSLKLLQILLLNEEVLSGTYQRDTLTSVNHLQSRNADHCFFFPVFIISRSFEVMESLIKLYGCIEKCRVHVIEQSDHKIYRKGVCVNLIFIKFTLRTITNCLVLI